MASTSLLLATLALMMLAVTVQAQAPPQNKYVNSVKSCYETSKNQFNKCLLQFWTDIKQELAKGLPDMKIPPLDPMSIDNIQFNEQGAVVQIKAIFSNVLVKGAINHEISGINIDLKGKVVTVNITMPALYITGTYDVDGTVLLLPVKGKGPFTLNLTNIYATAMGTFKRVGNQVKIDTLTVEFKIEGIKGDAQGLMGDNTVGDAVRNMLNDNSQQILEDVRPKVQEQLALAIKQTLAGGFLVLPDEVVQTIN